MTETNPEKIIRLWLAQLDERLSWLDQQLDDLTFDELVSWADGLDQRAKRLSAYVREMQTRAGGEIQHGDTRIVQGLDDLQIVTQRTVKSSARNVQRDDLMAAVDRLANSPDYRLDKATGELMPVPEARLQAYLAMFRMEPRWGELRKHGIEQDEFAEVDRVPAITTKKASN